MAECTCANPQAVANAINQQAGKISGSVDKGAQKLDETLYGQSMRGQHGAPAPVRFCNWAAPEYGRIGETAWTNLFQAAQLAIAIANGVAQAEIAAKQQDLADGYYQMAKYKWDRFASKYIPLEKKLLNEVSTAPIWDMDCDADRERAENAVDSAFSGISDFIKGRAKRYKLCIDASQSASMDFKQAVALVDTTNYNLRDDQWFCDFKNDQRWNRRGNVLNLGRNLGSQALQYGDVARALYKQVGAQLDRAASAAMTAMGYYGARNDTFYSTTYLGSNGGAGNSMLVNTAVPGGSINPEGMAAG